MLAPQPRPSIANTGALSEHGDCTGRILAAALLVLLMQTGFAWILTPWRCGVVGYSRVQWLVRDCALELARAYNEVASAWSFVLGRSAYHAVITQMHSFLASTKRAPCWFLCGRSADVKWCGVGVKWRSSTSVCRPAIGSLILVDDSILLGDELH